MAIAHRNSRWSSRSRSASTSAASGATRPEGRRFPVIDPATEESLCEVADATPEDAMAALDAAVAVQAEWGASAPNDRARSSGTPSSCSPSGPTSWHADDAGDGQAAGRVQVRDRVRGRLLPLVLGRGPAPRRLLQAVRQRHEPGAHDEAADRAEPDDHALELPHGDGHAQGGPGGGGGMHDRDEAGAAHAAVDAGAGPDPGGGGACPAGCSTSSPPRPAARSPRR